LSLHARAATRCLARWGLGVGALRVAAARSTSLGAWLAGQPALPRGAARVWCGGLPSPFVVTRYHSLAIEPVSMPGCLEVSATADDGEVMGVRHRELPVEGVQFHPEAILTEHGHALLRNFLDRAMH